MKRILIIDDDYQVRKMLRKMLENEGYEVIDAIDGAHGITLQKESPADLVITDLIMPEKEGIETIREMRDDFPEVKIIAISGGGRVSPAPYLRLATDMGAHYAFPKPVNKEELLNAIQGLLSS